MRTKLRFLICVGLVLSNSSVEAITGSGRFKSMMGYGIAAGTALYAYLGLLAKGEIFPYPIEKIEKEGLLVESEKIIAESGDILSGFRYRIKDGLKNRFYGSVGAGVTTAMFIHWVTSYYTPSYRYEWAIKERDSLAKSVLFNNHVTHENIKDMMIASGAESSPLQYVAIFLRLSDIDKKLSGLKSELETALKDVADGSMLSIQITNLLDQIDTDLIRIRESEHNVKSYDSQTWAKQWEIHTSTQLKEKQIAAMNKPQMNYHVGYYI